MLSLMVIWSELLGWTGGASWAPELSVVALIYHISGIAWAGQLIMILMVYLYMAFCVVFALYKLRSVFFFFSFFLFLVPQTNNIKKGFSSYIKLYGITKQTQEV